MINPLQITQNFSWIISDWSDVASIVSAITFFGVWISIIENIKQRRESYKPHLLFSSEQTVIEYGDNNRPSLWSQKNKSFEHCFYFNLENIGLGPSTDIRIIWLYPKSIENQIKVLANEIVKSDNRDMIVDIKMLQKYIKQKDVSNKPFLKSNETTTIHIPRFVFMYISFLINYQNDQIEVFDYYDIKSIKCKIQCKDLGGKSVDRLFEVSPVFYKESSDTDGLATGMFEFLEIHKPHSRLITRKKC